MDRENALNLDARNKIYKAVEECPGIHFRELKRRTNLAIGSLQYHLGVLEKEHVIKLLKDKRFTRYYPIKERILEEGNELLAFLRQEKIKEIVLFLLAKEKAKQSDIADAISLSPSTTSWYLKKLAEKEIVVKDRRGRKSYFMLKDEEKVKRVLSLHRKSFMDQIVDSFVEIWESELKA